MRYRCIAVFFLFLTIFLSCARVSNTTPPPQPASGFSLNDTIPLDSHVRTGKLSNGLTYYIRENPKPEDRAELRLVVNAGSILEDDDQQGLAHFNEHMAFNGTEHFKKHELVDYLELIGMKFGPELNAYTGFDETVYMLTIPTDSLDLVDTGLLVLRDWAAGMSLEDEEIDKERGVIREEWRLRRGAAARIRDKQYPILFNGSRYAERLPIGDMAVVDTCRYETLRRFYRDWYRPELMAVIAVGDFNADWIEKRIYEQFEPLRNPHDPRQRREFAVPDHPDTLFAIATDPEATRTRISLVYKRDRDLTLTGTDLRRRYVENLDNDMFNNRLKELGYEADPPFIYAESGTWRLARTKGAYNLSAWVSENGIQRGLRTLLEEAERVRLFGFTDTELEREKRAIIRRLERQFAEREKTESRRYAWRYASHYLSDSPAPGIEFTLEFARMELPGIDLDEVNALGKEWMTPGNLVVMVSAPEKEDVSIPESTELADIMERVDDATIEPYNDHVGGESLVAEPPKPGTIVSERRLDAANATEWILSNSATVVFKSTDFKDDEIIFTAFSPGGHSLVPDEDFIPARTAAAIVMESGVGGFTRTQLDKLLADKIVRVTPTIGELFEGMNGTASVQDMETMFQLIHLYFTEPRADSTAFEAYRSRQLAFVENREAEPGTAWRDTLQTTLYSHHYRYRPWTRELLDEMDLETSRRIYEDRFADAGDFTFVFVGSIDSVSFRSLTERYLASLPTIHRHETWSDIGVVYPDSTIEKILERGLEPKGRVGLVFPTRFTYTPGDRNRLRSVIEALRIRLRERIREDMGGTYGVSVYPSIDHYPRERALINISFGCDPERVDELTSAVFTQMDSIRSFGPTETELAKVVEMQRRSHERYLHENSYWMNALEQAYRHGESLGVILAVDDRINELSVETLIETAEKYLNREPHIRVVLLPENRS